MKNESNLILENQDFDHLNLKPYITNGRIKKIIFRNCTFDQPTLEAFQNCQFNDCYLDNLYMRKGQFTNCQFNNCQLVNLSFCAGDLLWNTFTNCSFINNDFRHIAIENCTFKDCQFQLDNEWMFQPISPIDRNSKLWHEGEWRTVTDWQEFLRLQTPN